MENEVMRVGVVGFGTIGQQVALKLVAGIPGMMLSAITSGDADKARRKLTALLIDVPVVDVEDLVQVVDVVVECAPTAAFTRIATAAIEARCTLVTVSGAAIVEHPELLSLAEHKGSKIILATGALLGLDAMRAAAEGTIHSVKMVTRKPPKSLRTARYIIDQNIPIMELQEPLKVFEGSAREGARRFPANVNVAASLGLAGVGPEKTELEIWADPTKTLNTHTISVVADSARFQMTIENVPSDENPGTGKITALSVIATLRAMVATLRTGT